MEVEFYFFTYSCCEKGECYRTIAPYGYKLHGYIHNWYRWEFNK